tara:strand:- start:46 stop:501 length:456 start_codon:yes stop_codon:yes gene_type:complete
MSLNKFPNFYFDKYFEGKVIAQGHLIQNFPRKIIKNLDVNFQGKVFKNRIIIKEDYKDGIKKEKRTWEFEKITKTKYVGIEENVIGNIDVKINKNLLKMRYIFRLIFKGKEIHVKIEDDMYLLNNREVINSTRVSKLGIKLAETFLLYKKI